MYSPAWNALVRNFGRPQLVVNAQLKQLHTFPFIKPHDSAAIIKFAQLVSSCVNVLHQFDCQGDLQSKSVLNSAVRKLPPELKTKWLFYSKVQQLGQADFVVFATWLNDVAFVHDELMLQFSSTNTNRDRTTASSKKKSTTAHVADAKESNKDSSSAKSWKQCPLEDGEHKIWNCQKFKEMDVQKRYEAIKKLKICYSCLDGKHFIIDCKSIRIAALEVAVRSTTENCIQKNRKPSPKRSLQRWRMFLMFLGFCSWYQSQ